MRLLFIAIIVFISSIAFSQKTGVNFLPPINNETPEWFQIFVKNSFENVNVIELDKTVFDFEKQFEINEKHEATENSNGEENENVYVLYYKRWRQSVRPYIKIDGTIDINAMDNITTENFTKSNIVPHPKKARGPNSPWSLIGPEETIWRKEHNAAQPPAPWQVNLYAIAMAPSNHDILYCAPETGGIFKTIDKGLNWTLVLDQAHATRTFYAIAIDPNNPNIVYAGQKNLIRKTTDGGLTWNSKVLTCSDINTIVIKPSNTLQLYVSAKNGLYRSTDSGANFAIVPGMATASLDVKFNEANDNTIMSISQSGMGANVYISTNNGTTFNTSIGWTGKGADTVSGGRIATTAADANRIYAVVLGSGASANKPFIFKSIDGGLNWDTTATGILNSLGGSLAQPLGMSNGQGYYDLDIMANPLNADELIVATTSAYRSINAGATFNAIGGYKGNFEIHPDIQEMIAMGSDAWISTDGGANYSNNFFATSFESRFKGIFGANSWGFGQGWNEDIIGGGRYHNGNTVMYENYPAGQALRMGGGEQGTGYAIMGRTRAMMFADLSVPGFNLPANINGTCTNFPFNVLPNEDYYGWDASDVEFFPSCFNIIYTGKDSMLWRSTNGAVSWTSLHTFPNKVKKFEIARSSPNVIYLAATTSLWKSIDSGLTWVQLSVPSGTSIDELKIQVDFTNENIVWISSTYNPNNKKIYKSIDGGATWINLSTAILNNYKFEYMSMQQGTQGGIYMAADGGKVFYRNDTMSNWVDFSNNLPQGTEVLKTIPFYRDGKLRLAGNRGYWEVDFYEASNAIVQPTVDKLISNCPRDTFFFDDFSVLNHATATWSWSFPGANYISATNIKNPKVLYPAIGNYIATLTITQNGISQAKNIAVNIVDNICLADTVVGHALSVNAQSNYAYTNTVRINNTRKYTMMAWVKGNDTQVDYAGILSVATDSGNVHLNVRGVGTDSTQIGYHHPDGSYSFNTGHYLKPNEWAHLAIVVDSTKITIYKDGVAAIHSGRNIKLNSISKFQIGSMLTSEYYRNFNGLIDEVALFDTALTQNQIRETMNLTRNNPNYVALQYNPHLISYYQFNETNAQPTYDKVNSNHLVLNGSAINKDTISTAPVGGGIAQRINVTAGGIANFANVGVELDFPAVGNKPNGDLVVTRINTPSDVPCNNFVLPNTTKAYFVIRNYGTNKTIAPLNKIKFSNIHGTDPIFVNAPNLLSLSKRKSNDFGNTWGAPIDYADSVKNNSGIGSVVFSTGLNVTSFSQFSIGYAVSQPLATNLLKFNATLLPQNITYLNWEIADPSKISKYIVEHSTDAKNFKSIGEVPASTNANYNFNHDAPSIGQNYYKLKMMDNANNIAYSETKLINILADKINVIVSPNPSNDGWISILFAGAQKNENVSLNIVNEAGQIINTIYFTNSNVPEYIHLPSNGIFVLNFTFSKGVSVSKKVIVR
jgi:photosystem II stability/assembly factor-like uncharacterized protein